MYVYTSQGKLCTWAVACNGHNQWAWQRWPTKRRYLWRSRAVPNDSKVGNFNLFIMLRSRSNASMSRSDNFSADDRCHIKPIALPPSACMWGTSIIIESHNYAPLLCMLALGKTGEGAYRRDSDIYMQRPLPTGECHMGARSLQFLW